MGKSIYGISVAGETYYPRPIYTAKLVEVDVQAENIGTPIENHRFYQISVDNYPIELNSNGGVNESIIIKFDNSYRGLLWTSTISFSDSLTIDIRYDGADVNYIDVNEGDYFELINGSDYIWDIVSMNKQCMDIRHEDLVVLSENNCLIPGMKYRIIDYVTMDEYTIPDARGVLRNVSYPHHFSMKRQFDIIVTAETRYSLSPIASAASAKYPQNPSTYFLGSKLSKWKLWYSLTGNDCDFGYELGIEPGKCLRPIPTAVEEVFYGYNYTMSCIPGQMPTSGKTRMYITPATTLSGSYLLCYAPYLTTNKVFRLKAESYNGIVNVASITAISEDSLGVTYYNVKMTNGKTYSDLRPISISLMSAEDNIQESLLFFESSNLNKLILVNISSNTIQAVLTPDGATSADDSLGRLTRGVIYRMIDEFGNDAPYDFKNIVSYTPAFDGGASYTFSGSSSDLTIGGHSYNNVIGQQIGTDGKHYIPYISMGVDGQDGTFNCSIGSNVKYIYVPAHCSNIHIGNDCSVIMLGTWDYTVEVADVFIGNNCNSVDFEDLGYISFFTTAIGNSCTNINLISDGSDVENVNIGNFCNDIDIAEAYNNTIGSGCYSIVCEYGCHFGDNCYEISTGSSCYFGRNCHHISSTGSGNTFGDRCNYIYFGGISNTFGNDCDHIYGGITGFNYNIFEDRVKYVLFATGRTSNTDQTYRRSYCQYNLLKVGVRNVVIYSTTTPSSTAILRNIHIETPPISAQTSYRYTGASTSTGAAINSTSIQKYTLLGTISAGALSTLN